MGTGDCVPEKWTRPTRLQGACRPFLSLEALMGLGILGLLSDRGPGDLLAAPALWVGEGGRAGAGVKPGWSPALCALGAGLSPVASTLSVSCVTLNNVWYKSSLGSPGCWPAHPTGIAALGSPTLQQLCGRPLASQVQNWCRTLGIGAEQRGW